jgi:phenylacetate-CoA ligase
MARPHYDALESRDADLRERELFSRLPDLISLALTAPGWARQLAGVDPNEITTRAALARLPVLRPHDLPALRREFPPFGGFNVTAPGRLRRLLVAPGPVFRPEGVGRDWWGAARALHAAGMRAGDVVLNGGAGLAAGGAMMEAGLHALGCAVITGGGDVGMQVDAVAQLRPSAYAGPLEDLAILLNAAIDAGKDATSLQRALVFGTAPAADLRKMLDARGLSVRECYVNPDTGIVAYESEAAEGLIVNETVLVEIVRPGTGELVEAGDVGEILVTSFNADYPMIRLATGDISAVLKGRSPCGRTNMRLKGLPARIAASN